VSKKKSPLILGESGSLALFEKEKHFEKNDQADSFMVKKTGYSFHCNPLIFSVASPKVLPIYSTCHLLIIEYCKYYEFYPTMRHKNPIHISPGTDANPSSEETPEN
jgi:hypothetical protein